jgi:hypothetical protein
MNRYHVWIYLSIITLLRSAGKHLLLHLIFNIFDIQFIELIITDQMY